MSRPKYSDASESTKGSKDYVLITIAENNVLQSKNENLIQRIRNSLVFINDAETDIQKRNNELLDWKEWLSYLACEKMPKPFQPEAIRRYFFKTIVFEEDDIENTVNWLLAANERSVLTQDIDALNLTRQYIKQNRVDFGEQYDNRVRDAMEISKRIQNFLEDPIVMLSERILQDVSDLKYCAYQQINTYIDNLTYRVLCSEDAYMDTPFKEVYMHQTKTALLLPFSVLCRNMVIRCLHCHFDHFSPHARYFELPKIDSAEQYLPTCLETEWETQKKIQAEVRARMIQQRADYEEAMRLLAEEEELKAKLRKFEAKDGNAQKVEKPKAKKPSKEPPIVTADLVPVVRRDFLIHDFYQHEASMMKLNPDIFGLRTGEINLRKYQILGGVYKINCLSKPRVTNLPKLVMAWYRVNSQMEYRKTEIEFDANQAQDIQKFFKITFELPECFCHWGEPLPCLFEEGTLFQDQFDGQNRSSRVLNVTTPIIINDFNLHELFNRPLMYNFIENSIPRIISSFRFPEDLNDDEEDKKAKATFGRSKPTAAEKEREKERMMQKQMLSFEAQYCPERLFPLFKKVLPVVILPLEDENEKLRTHPYENFSEFVSALESIKSSYRMSKFKDKDGKPITILAEKYDKNIRRPKKDMITGKLVAEGDKLDEAPSRVSVMQMKGLVDSSQSLEIEAVQEEVTHEVEVTKSKKKKGKRLSKHKTEEVIIEPEVKEEIEGPTEFSKWSTVNILKKEFDPSKKKITIWTDRLGTFGFAFYRYQHFPFQSWSIQPNIFDPSEIELHIESMFAVFRIYITTDGYKVAITDFAKYIKTRKVYLEIVNPISDIKEFKEKLQQKNLNIFPERDASWYLTGYFSEKHEAVENHIYNCISLYATTLKYICSFWNKLSDRRTMVFKFGELRDAEDDMFLIRVTPEDVMFVEIKEVCTDLETIQLEYAPTWRNLEWYPDLNYLISSTYGSADEMRVKDPSIIYYLKTLLQVIRPLSYS